MGRRFTPRLPHWEGRTAAADGTALHVRVRRRYVVRSVLGPGVRLPGYRPEGRYQRLPSASAFPRGGGFLGLDATARVVYIVTKGLENLWLLCRWRRRGGKTLAVNSLLSGAARIPGGAERPRELKRRSEAGAAEADAIARRRARSTCGDWPTSSRRPASSCSPGGPTRQETSPFSSPGPLRVADRSDRNSRCRWQEICCLKKQRSWSTSLSC
jgi:hypothetical protein